MNVTELKRVQILLRDSAGKELATLKPVNRDILPEIFEISLLLSEWREKTKRFFKTGFEKNASNTESWLRKTVIENDSKILYLILVNNRVIGHFGLTNIQDGSAELDNAIRGVKGGHPDLFRYAEFVILDLAFNYLGLKYVCGHLFSNNIPAMTLHKQFGFSEVTRKPLKLVSSDSRWEYVVCSDEEKTERFTFVHINLEASDFITKIGTHFRWEFLKD